MKQLVAYILVLFLSISCKAQTIHFHNYKSDLKSVIENLKINTNQLSITIDKSDYKLTIHCDTIVLKEYPVVFGENPVDDKLMQGDNCTPEGKFFMNMKYTHKKWNKFIWLNYPTEESWAKHNAAIQHGKIPQNAKIGGDIGIHGVPVEFDFLIDIRFNWTAGCISLKNKDIDEIFQYITKSTPIIIQK